MKRIAALTLWASCLAAFLYGVTVNLPWIVAENARLKPWKIPLLWSSEFTALILFLEYGMRSALQLESRVSALTLKVFLIATAVDLGLSVASIINENSAHSRALQTQGEVVTGHSRLQCTGHKRYTLDCRFHDQRGVPHTSWFSCVDDGVPGDVRAAIDQQQLPVDIAIAYDPIWPKRSWIADAPYSHDNRLFIYSLMTIMCSALLTAALATFHRLMPWLPNPRVAPFLGATWVFLMVVLLQGGW